MSEKTPFWKSKTLDSMSHDEWESLCDGCARCCVHKLEDEETGDIYHTDVACRLLDAKTCRCTDYAHRTRRVADCLEIRPDNVHELTWLPATCAYRRLAEGKDLQWWHPLVSNDPKTVIEPLMLATRAQPTPASACIPSNLPMFAPALKHS